ncbi:MAG: hypothetical protein ACO2ZM_09425 [Francisellaceae bacterium]
MMITFKLHNSEGVSWFLFLFWPIALGIGVYTGRIQISAMIQDGAKIILQRPMGYQEVTIDLKDIFMVEQHLSYCIIYLKDKRKFRLSHGVLKTAVKQYFQKLANECSTIKYVKLP